MITREHIESMKDGAILCNTGHFNVEIDIPALRSLAVETREARQFVEEFTLADGRRLYLLADGRLVNISAAEGHPAIVMDMSFANQALSTEYAVQHAASLERKVYPVPREIDEEIARLKLAHDGRHDRPAHRGAGEVPGLVGRRHLSRIALAAAISLAAAAPAGAAIHWRRLADGSAAGGPAAPATVAYVALDRAATAQFSRRLPVAARTKIGPGATSVATRSSPSSASSAAATTPSPCRRSTRPGRSSR